jgi:WD40 repeat protein
MGTQWTTAGRRRAGDDGEEDGLELPEEEEPPGPIIASGDSNREIRFWRLQTKRGYEISPAEARGEDIEGIEKKKKEEEAGPLIAHETSVVGLEFVDGDIWTASLDRTTKRLSAHQGGYGADTTLTHPDYVTCVAVFEALGLVVTGSRDEEIRVWEIGSGRRIATLSGHYDQVTGFATWGNSRLVSVSIDGTVRVWSLARDDLKKAEEDYRNGPENEEDKSKTEAGLLTEDEEAELAALMEDD